MAVKIPMMPKGVEHPPPPVCAAGNDGVKIPMMPKGVEHSKKPKPPALDLR